METCTLSIVSVNMPLDEVSIALENHIKLSEETIQNILASNFPVLISSNISYDNILTIMNATQGRINFVDVCSMENDDQNTNLFTLIVLNRNRKLIVANVNQDGKIDIKDDFFILQCQYDNEKVLPISGLSPKELYFMNVGYLSINFDFIYDGDFRKFEDLLNLSF